MISLYLWAFLILTPAASADLSVEEPFWKWSLSKAVKLLNESPWARQETYTTVIGGVGSGRSGEKEIYNRFYIRFLSAKPIREAFARVQQIQHGYDDLDEVEKQRFDEILRPGLEMDVDRWVVVSVSFRSNDPDQESQVRRYFQTETTETLKDKAFLSTNRLSQVRLHAYFPPREESVGAKFVFPREVDGTELVSEEKGSISFELLDLPISTTRRGGGSDRDSRDNDSDSNSSLILRATFALEEMEVDGRLIL